MLHPALRRSALTVVVAVSLLALGGLAEAATKITPALEKSGATTESFDCRILNTSNRDLTNVSVTIFAGNGGVLFGFVFGVVSPGTAQSVIYSESASIGYCKVEGKFPAKSVLVTFCRRLTAASGSLACVTAQ